MLCGPANLHTLQIDERPAQTIALARECTTSFVLPASSAKITVVDPSMMGLPAASTAIFGEHEPLRRHELANFALHRIHCAVRRPHVDADRATGRASTSQTGLVKPRPTTAQWDRSTRRIQGRAAHRTRARWTLRVRNRAGEFSAVAVIMSILLLAVHVRPGQEMPPVDRTNRPSRSACCRARHRKSCVLLPSHSSGNHRSVNLVVCSGSIFESDRRQQFQRPCRAHRVPREAAGFVRE